MSGSSGIRLACGACEILGKGPLQKAGATHNQEKTLRQRFRARSISVPDCGFFGAGVGAVPDGAGTAGAGADGVGFAAGASGVILADGFGTGFAPSDLR